MDSKQHTQNLLPLLKTSLCNAFKIQKNIWNILGAYFHTAAGVVPYVTLNSILIIKSILGITNISSELLLALSSSVFTSVLFLTQAQLLYAFNMFSLEFRVSVSTNMEFEYWLSTLWLLHALNSLYPVTSLYPVASLYPVTVGLASLFSQSIAIKGFLLHGFWT